MSEANKIYLLRGNDTPLSVCLRKREGDGDPVPYDLSTAERMRLALVGHGMHVFAVDIAISGEDDNIVSGVIPGRSLLKGDYDLEVTFRSGGRDKRFAVEDMFEAVDFLAEDADGETEGEGAGIWVNVTVQPEVIEIAGPTGPKGDTPVLTADEDGTIYADGVLLTEVVKDVTEAVESAERSRVTAESQRVAAESARVRAEQSRAAAETARQTAEGNRTTAESERVAAETARESASATAVQNAETATAAANTAAEHAEEAAATIRRLDTNYVRKDNVKQAPGQSETDVLSQKAVDDNYARKVGVENDLVVGAAKALAGNQRQVKEFTTMVMEGADGIAKINEVKGKSLGWNQLAKALNSSGWKTPQSGNLSFSDGVAHLEATSTIGQSIQPNLQEIVPTAPIVDHHYLVSFDYRTGENHTAPSLNGRFGVNFNLSVGNLTANMPWTTKALVITATSSSYPFYLWFYFSASETQSYTADIYFRNIQIIDLTQMFGAGSEPSTVEEFEALFPLPYYDYNAGEIISNKTEKLDVTGFNLFDSHEAVEISVSTYTTSLDKSKLIQTFKRLKALNKTLYYNISAKYTSTTGATPGRISLFYRGTSKVIDSGSEFTLDDINLDLVSTVVLYGSNRGATLFTDAIINISDPAKNGTYESYKSTDIPLNLPTITGKLNGEGESVTIFPDGMKSAGTVYDSLIVDEDGWCRRAVVRLTTHIFSGNEPVQVADWRHVDGYFAAGLKKSGLTGIKDFAGILMPDLPTITYGSIFNTTSPKEGIASYESPYSVFIRVLSSKASTSAELLAWLNGKTLIYELATPQEYVLDTPIQMTFQAKHGGVIRQLPENGSAPTTAPMRMSVTYALPAEALISGASLENLLNALKTANKISNYTMTYNPTSGKWEFTIS